MYLLHMHLNKTYSVSCVHSIWIVGNSFVLCCSLVGVTPSGCWWKKSNILLLVIVTGCSHI